MASVFALQYDEIKNDFMYVAVWSDREVGVTADYIFKIKDMLRMQTTDFMQKRGKSHMKKRILIINTGGTLSSVNGENGLMPGMKSRDMLEELRMVSRNLELETEDFCSVGQRQYFSGGLGKACGADCKKKQGVPGNCSDSWNRHAGIHGVYAVVYASEYFYPGSGNRKSVVYCNNCGRRYGELPLWDTYGGKRLPGCICGI